MAHPNSQIDDSDEQELCQLFAELPLGPITIYPAKAHEREFKYFSKLPAELQVMIWKYAAAFTSNLVHVFDHPKFFYDDELPPLKFPMYNFCSFYAWPWQWMRLANTSAYRTLAPLSDMYRPRHFSEESFPETIRLRPLNSRSGKFCPDIAYFGSWNAMRYIIREADRPFIESVEVIAMTSELHSQTEHWFFPAMVWRFVNLKELLLVIGDDDTLEERKNRLWPWELVPVKGGDVESAEEMAKEIHDELAEMGQRCCYDLRREMRKLHCCWADIDKDNLLHENWHRFLDMEPLPTPHENAECRKGWKAPAVRFVNFRYHNRNGRENFARDL